jgi:hypothetical protein
MFRDQRSGWGLKVGKSLITAFVLLFAMTAAAQLEVGDNVKMNLNGDLGFGYNAASGNSDINSTHSYGLSGSANLTGYYFHPNFLNFQVRPYFDRSQVSSDSQAVTRSEGLGATAGFFGGSRFPGSISYGKDFSSNSEFRLAGIPSLLGNSSGQNFSIAWSELMPRLPQVTVSYALGSNEASIDGLSPNHSSGKNLNLNSSYQILGFSLQGNLSHNTNSFETPQYFTNEAFKSGGSGTTYGLSAQHVLPLRGAVSFGWAHSSFESDTGTEWSSNSYTANNSFAPWRRLTLYQNVSYSTNLSAAFVQSALNGANTPFFRNDYSSEGLYYGTGANLQVSRSLTIGGHYSHRIQWLTNDRFSDSQYGGNLNYNYNHKLFGLLYFGVGVVDIASKNGNDGAAFNATAGMSKKFGHWDTSADFNYSQNLQTLITVATTSSYNYGVSVRRRLNQDTSFGGSYRSSHSGFVTQAGNGNRAESASGGLSWRKYSVSASYAQSNGTAVLNSEGGLTATPVGPIISEDFLLFNARSLGVGASTRLFRRVNVSGGYSKFTSSTTEGALGTLNSGSRYNVRTEYRLRKFSFIGGFNRAEQEVSLVPGGPRVINSYYLSFTRWFNVF